MISPRALNRLRSLKAATCRQTDRRERPQLVRYVLHMGLLEECRPSPQHTHNTVIGGKAKGIPGGRAWTSIAATASSVSTFFVEKERRKEGKSDNPTWEVGRPFPTASAHATAHVFAAGGTISENSTKSLISAHAYLHIRGNEKGLNMTTLYAAVPAGFYV